MDYKIEIRDQWANEDKFSLVPQEVAYVVSVYIDGKLSFDHFNISSMEKAGAIALYYETFFKYYKQN
jgi:hypothetical protein